jgi:hypothetical protein
MDRYDQHGGVVHRSSPEDAATCAAVMPVSETWPIPLAPSSDISSLATSFRDLTIARWRVVNPELSLATHISSFASVASIALRHSVFPRAAATWHGLSPCLALMVGERSVNLSNHLGGTANVLACKKGVGLIQPS